MIRALEIDNFRGFKSIRLADLRRFTLITGANASGKTALLEALFISGGNDFEIYIRTNSWRGKDVIQLPTTPSELIPVIDDYFYQFEVETGIAIRFADSKRGPREIRVVATPQDVLSLPFDKKAAEASVPGNFNLKFFWKTPEKEFESEVEATPRGLRLSKPDSVYFMMFINTATVGSESDMATRYSLLSKQNKEAPIIDAIKRIFPHVLGVGIETDSGGNSVLHASVSGLSRKIPLGLLSFGIKKFANILIGICSAANGAVLIDEIENGMYYKIWPKMWSEIVALAEENKTQVFAATHSKEFLDCISPAVSANAKDYELIHTEKINGECRTHEFTGKQFASALAQGFEVR